jgi:hypothetical protein
MDHSKTASPHFSHKNKSTESFMKLPVSVTGMIAHGHGDIRYAHYALDLYPANSNHTVGSIAKVLRDLEDVPKFVSREIFPNSHASPLFDAVLEGGEVCNSSLSPPPKANLLCQQHSLLSYISNWTMHAQIIRTDIHSVFSPCSWRMVYSGKYM